MKLPGDVFKKLSSVVRPTDVGRDSAFVNVNGVATRAVSVSGSSASVGFRRMNSISAVSPGAHCLCRAAAGVETSAIAAQRLMSSKGSAMMPAPSSCDQNPHGCQAVGLEHIAELRAECGHVPVRDKPPAHELLR